MIEQFAELGRYYREREGGGESQLLQYAADPAAKFRSTAVLLILFSPSGFERVQVEQGVKVPSYRFVKLSEVAGCRVVGHTLG